MELRNAHLTRTKEELEGQVGGRGFHWLCWPTGFQLTLTPLPLLTYLTDPDINPDTDTDTDTNPDGNPDTKCDAVLQVSRLQEEAQAAEGRYQALSKVGAWVVR